jgi:hypothetical protein
LRQENLVDHWQEASGNGESAVTRRDRL